MKCYRGDYSPNHPAFPEGSPAVCQETTGPVPICTPDISYTQGDDDAIKTLVRASGKHLSVRYMQQSNNHALPVSTTWHSVK